MEFFTKYRGLLISGGLLVLAFIVVLSFYGSVNGTQKDMVSKESRLSAKYQDNQNVLST